MTDARDLGYEIGRCTRTGNLCGTDTWSNGFECDCGPCSRMLLATARAQLVVAQAGLEKVVLETSSVGVASIADEGLRNRLLRVVWKDYVDAGGQGQWGVDLETRQCQARETYKRVEEERAALETRKIEALERIADIIAPPDPRCTCGARHISKSNAWHSNSCPVRTK